MDNLTLALYGVGAAAIIAFAYIVWSYARGLRGSPRELWLLYIGKIIEYGAYGAANMAFILYLSADVGLTDVEAGSYIGVWSMSVTIFTMLVGAVCDAIGIKRTLVIGTVALLFARIVMPLSTNIVVVTLFGFLPIAFGTAVVGPVMSVGIKRYTTKEGATLGFGLLYTMFNVGWALGGLIFDWVRGALGEHSLVDVPVLGVQMSTYQVIFSVSFLLTLPTLTLFLMMRSGVERLDDGRVVIHESEKREGSPLAVILAVSRSAAVDTVRILKTVFREKAFWIYISMLGMLVPVRLVFYHFHYTWPKYGIRVLGEGVKIGNIYGVLNPLLIVFLVPFIAVLTKKVSSYKMLMVGTFISAFAVFIASFPARIVAPLMDTWVGELILDRWLEVPEDKQQPLFILLVIFIIVFTIGEAIWSPRLTQFTAEIAPKGKEGSYISLSYLPYFAAKLIAGPMSGFLVAAYTPELPEGADQGYANHADFVAANYPHHWMVWIWIGGMALISPIGLVALRKLYRRAEQKDVTEIAE